MKFRIPFGKSSKKNGREETDTKSNSADEGDRCVEMDTQSNRVDGLYRWVKMHPAKTSSMS
jgi:hypothetical protein